MLKTGKGKRKGKGKGQEKGGTGEGKKGKGKGKGPKDGCWICGGPHYASNCPQGKSKGKGKGKPTYGLSEEEDWETWDTVPEVRSLSGLTTIEPHLQPIPGIASGRPRAWHSTAASHGWPNHLGHGEEKRWSEDSVRV